MRRNVLEGCTVTEQDMKQDVERDISDSIWLFRIDLYYEDHCTQCWLTAIGPHPFRKCTEKPTQAAGSPNQCIS